MGGNNCVNVLHFFTYTYRSIYLFFVIQEIYYQQFTAFYA